MEVARRTFFHHRSKWLADSYNEKDQNLKQVTAEVFDKEVALSRVGGDAELLKEIAVLFLEDYPRSLADLHEAVNAGDAKRVERAAHGLKGAVSNFGAISAVEAALKLETLGRAREMADVAQVLQSLEQALAALRPELEAL
jgi:HPt (histidine-containing phosphotransfer) domain-containing protein